MSLHFDVFVPDRGLTEAGQALSRMLAEESPGKAYAKVMRLRVSGALADQCADTYFVAHKDGECVSRLWNGWGRHGNAIGNFGNFLTLESCRGQGIGTRLLELWYDDLCRRTDKPLALFCTSAPKAALMYERYGMRPIAKGATYGPSFMPLGNSPERFEDFCKAYYQPADELYPRPASFAYRHEIDLLLKFALVYIGLPFGFDGMPSVEQALLSSPEKAKMLFTKNGRCVGWSYDGAIQIYPLYSKASIIN